MAHGPDTVSLDRGRKMTALVVNSNSGATATTTASYACPLPASLVSGNKLYLFVGTVILATVYSLDTPSGWTLEADLQNNDASTHPRLTIFSKTSDGSEGATVTVAITGGTPSVNFSVVSVQIQNHNGTDVSGMDRTGSVKTTLASPSVTTTVNDSLVLLANVSYLNLVTRVVIPAINITAVANATIQLYCGVCYTTQGSAGATTAQTWAFDDTDIAVSATVAVKPALSGPAPIIAWFRA